MQNESRQSEIHSKAPGQLVGYTVQYFRALLHLLQCKMGESVSIEHLGDVAIHQNDERVIFEEDKSSISDNPLGDLSTNLWKTLYNWVQFLVDANIDVSKCRFLLYVISPVAPRSLLASFASANDPKSVNNAICKAKRMVKKSSSEEINRYANAVLKDNIAILRKILVTLEVVVNQSEREIEAEIANEFRSAMISENRIEEVKNHCLGWVVKKIVHEIRNKRSPIIDKDEFIRQNIAFINQVRAGSLVDYSLSNRPTKDELAAEALSDKNYIRQLQAIDVDQSKMISACSDYYRAGINRQAWIEKELISPEEADEFEAKLCSAYEREKERIELEKSDLCDLKKGRLLLNACEGQQVRIADRDPVDRTIPGTYHHLSDDLKLGWHPQWRMLFCDGGLVK